MGAGALCQGQTARVGDVIQHCAWGRGSRGQRRLGLWVGNTVTGWGKGPRWAGHSPEGREDLPGGQKQPSTQWSSQSWARPGLEQVSAQGEPHSRCCMLPGQVWAAGRGSAWPQEAWAPRRGTGSRPPCVHKGHQNPGLSLEPLVSRASPCAPSPLPGEAVGEGS